MINIFIHGLKDGEHPFDLIVPVEEVDDMFPEFIGNIEINGKIRVLGNRFTLFCTAKCNTRLICDISLKEFEHPVEVEFSISYHANTDLYWLNKDSEKNSESEIVIHEDLKEIDISTEIREQLALSLPMKRISPEYEGKSFEEIHPELFQIKEQEDNADERWSALKNIKLN